MATSVAARGPLTLLLQSSSGQYLVLGLGACALFPDHVQRLLAPLLGHPAIRQFGEPNTNGDWRNQPIIIHTPSPTVVHSQGGGHGGKSWMTVVIYSAAGAGACWVGYIVCSQLLPDAVSEFMPVTKRLFQSTTERLGVKMVELKELFQEQLNSLLQKQQSLEQQQKDTHDSVKDVQSQLGEARLDMVQLQHSLDRCENGLDHSNNMQGYTLRGIRLLVRCVTSFLPDESNFIEDISRYIEDGQQGDGILLKPTHGGGAPPGGAPFMRSQSQPDPYQYNQHHHHHQHVPSHSHRAMPPPPPQAYPVTGNPSLMLGGGGAAAGRHMSSKSFPTVPLPHPSTVFEPPGQDYLSTAPSITSIDSSCEDDGNNAASGQGHFSMGDIRALLGH